MLRCHGAGQVTRVLGRAEGGDSPGEEEEGEAEAG